MKSVSELAEITGIDRRTVSKRLSELTPEVRGKAHLYPTAPALRLILLAGSGTDARLDPQQEKALLDRERRLLVELERRTREGELLPIGDVREEWTRLIGRARSRLLSLPAHAAPLVAGTSDLRQIENVLRDAVHLALADLSGGQIDED